MDELAGGGGGGGGGPGMAAPPRPQQGPGGTLNLPPGNGAPGGGGPAASEAAGPPPGPELSRPQQYTIPGILHYIQHEWARFEMERAHWEVERAELQVPGRGGRARAGGPGRRPRGWGPDWGLRLEGRRGTYLRGSGWRAATAFPAPPPPLPQRPAPCSQAARCGHPRGSHFGF